MNNAKSADLTAKTNKQDELIFIDEREISQVRKQMKKAESRLNDFYRLTVLTLGELKPDQIKDLPFNGKSVIKKELESRFQFPKADDQFNLTALGIDPAPAYKKYKPVHWNKYKFDFSSKKDGFILLADEKQPELNRHYYFADSTAKKQAVDVIRDLLGLKDELIKYGFITGNNDSYLFDLLNYKPIKREKGIGQKTPIVFNPSGFVKIFKDIEKGRF